jgi:ribosomal protein S18 acetylase RimI-like enzyme
MTRKSDAAGAILAGITLRPALPEDEAFLFGLYAETRADELAQTGWDDAQKQAFLKMQFAAQQQHYRSYYPQGEHSVILLGDNPIGRLYLARSSEEIRILDITIQMGKRNAGIGRIIIKDLMAEAAEISRPLRIYVETFNRALGLFERLGFERAEQKDIHCLMQWQSTNRQSSRKPEQTS